MAEIIITELFSSRLFLLIVFLIGIGLVVSNKKKGPLPPGPRGLPILGNITDLPARGEREWEHWLKHKDVYGPISSVTALGTTIVVLHSRALAVELLEKQSALNSSRTRLVFGGEMVGWGNTLPLLPYDDRFRASRKHVHLMIGTRSSIEPYILLQEVEVHRFLFRILQEPDKLLSHIRTEAGAIILKMIYGYTIEPHNMDPLVELAATALDQFSASTVPGAWLVDVIPALRYIPEWMPGAGFKRTAREWRKNLRDVTETPLRFTRKQMSRGKYEKSYVADLCEKAGEDISLEDEYVLKWTALSLYGGGADTTVSTLRTFFLAMMLHPEVQLKAREEIDRVVGSSRLPTYDDRDQLPYIQAIVTEAWRWHPVAPMGVPHVASADNVLGGYNIPKGAIIVQNIWWFTHDPAVYPNPSAFDPSRHLGLDPAPDPRDDIFGYGRRICPGRHLAESTVWLTIARSLAVFEIGKGLDDIGSEIEPSVSFSPGIISHPGPFQATIKPRSPHHEALIRNVEVLHPWEESSAGELEISEV
ncbi:cytochrome P450 oxidoreductase OrdA-like protein [Xylariaceae sp. AK1471]|nr:cytochrome P450 oxidoreductase OrdA-like protein [Xylariaceae sp. AK1471]